MTVIAWDGKTLAADKATKYGGSSANLRKIFRVNGALVGGAGNAAHILEMVEWFRAGAKPADLPAFQRSIETNVAFLVVTPKGELWEYNNGPYPIVIEERQYAIGSGDQAARVAMYLGKSAKEAVEVAIRFNTGCSGGVDELRHEPTIISGALNGINCTIVPATLLVRQRETND